MGILFITHDLNLVADFADTVAVLYQGELVEKGPVTSIFKQAQHPYTKALLACRPALYSKGELLPTVADFLNTSSAPIATETPHKEAIQTSAETLLRVSNLHVWYPTRYNLIGKPEEHYKAVNDVSFDVMKGETLGLVGESGCGKSTLGRALLGLIKTNGGQITYRDTDLTQCNRQTWQSLRKEMQLIFQDPYASLNPSIPIGEAIAEPLAVHKIYPTAKARKEAVIDLLERVQLKADHYDRYPHQFSGGQRQRIVIARALALQPSFVVCDESVSALDVSVQAQVLNLLNELKESFGFTAIFISHDLSVVRYISDRIMVMQKGRIVESGSSNQVYHHPQSAYTQQLIAAIPKGIIA
jgi:peptide/nickel transport system ATP-binding protein